MLAADYNRQVLNKPLIFWFIQVSHWKERISHSIKYNTSFYTLILHTSLNSVPLYIIFKAWFSACLSSAKEFALWVRNKSLGTETVPGAMQIESETAEWGCICSDHTSSAFNDGRRQSKETLDTPGGKNWKESRTARGPREAICSTSNLWPDLVSPCINADHHSKTRSQQEQQAQWGQGEEPEHMDTWDTLTAMCDSFGQYRAMGWGTA